ncbi:MAG: LAGLIDADG family homing endonuclease [Candidatus Taylorbacteria bacterium]|nr:LAGLIDADG family homing endonuclease [Candidatus Taylorbacteria bacterium]
MPIHKEVNQDFFKKWLSKMAYVLGFFTADGNMIRNKRGAHFIDFYITDRDILEKIKKLLGSNHKISIRDRRKVNPNYKIGYRLQIGSKMMFNDLINLGLMPNKSKVVRMPSVPSKYVSHFVRGYFDGDGHVSASEYQKKDRKNKSRIIITGFTSGSKIFLEGLRKVLKDYAVTKGGTFFYTQGYRLCFSIQDSLKLYNFMYKDSGTLYLDRKKVIFEHYFDNLLRA